VAHFVITELLRRGRRFDLRLFLDKALPDYQQWKDGEAESDWMDLVAASIEEHLAAVRHLDSHQSRAGRKEAEQTIAREIVREHATREDRVRAWAQGTGKSERAFYRRLAEIERQFGEVSICQKLALNAKGPVV
jgi:hypothetical protein